MFLVTNINTFVLWRAGGPRLRLRTMRAVRGEMSPVAACLSRMIYDLKTASRNTAEYEKFPVAGQRARLSSLHSWPQTAGESTAVSIPRRQSDVCFSAMKAGEEGL